MKQLTIRSISLLLALIMVLLMIPSAQAYTLSGWAEPEVSGMRDLGLIPDSLISANLTKGITRLDMCRIAVLSYEKLTGKTIKVSNKTPFPDTKDTSVAKAYAVGLVKGSDDGKFHPDTILTRGQFIAFVDQYLKAVGYTAESSDYAELTTFSDGKSAPDWIKTQTRLVVGLGIVKGSDGKLNLGGNTSRQEALAMFYRAYFAALKDLKGAYPNTSGWAQDSLGAMDALVLVPDTVKYSSMTGSITRLDMCRIVMNTYKYIWGISDEDMAEGIDPIKENPFTDTENIDVINTYILEIVSGDGNGKFRPNDPITRQEFFKITYNFLLAMGFGIEDDGSVNLRNYADGSQVSSYAVTPTKVLISLGIVKGDDAKKLHPRDNIICQEAIVIFYRTYEYIMNWTGGPSYEDESQMKIQQVIELALEIEADDSLWYVYGGKKPSDGGFDCSGFVSYVYNQKAGTKFSPPVSSIWNAIPDYNIIPKDKLIPGDIVFFHTDSSKTEFQHVGLYIGNGQFVHAANSRKGIIISSLNESYYQSHYMNAKRVFT